ncbi:hypothetical protein OPQ81_010880 [Rhizoctonia solani]|nr:hypothetical protein OPQ81_010880 [Rhizoctonia solani]
MISPNHIEYHGILKHAPKFVFQSLIEKVIIQPFPDPQYFTRWRVFIEFKLKWFGIPIILEIKNTKNKLTCARVTRGPILGEPQLILPGHQNRPQQVTVERVLKIAANFRRTLYVTKHMTEQQRQSQWALWVLNFAMELGEREPIPAYPTTLYEFRDRVIREISALN